MKRLFFILLLINIAARAFAQPYPSDPPTYVTGGDMSFAYVGPGTATNTNKYKITLVLYRNNDSFPELQTIYPVHIFNGYNYGEIFGPFINRSWPIAATSGHEEQVPVIQEGKCVAGAPHVSYLYRTYTMTVELGMNDWGYYVVFGISPKPEPINNIVWHQNPGTTCYCFIPGAKGNSDGKYSSPKFSDTIPILCAGSKFSFQPIYNTDPAYGYQYFLSFANTCGAPHPPFTIIQFDPNYLLGRPLGYDSHIDSTTGEIYGIAPDVGAYLVPILVDVYKDGKYFTTLRKDILVQVFDCRTATATIGTVPGSFCDSLNVQFTNASYNPVGTTYRWDFGDPASSNNSSTVREPAHLYSGPGDYTVGLYTDVDGGGLCKDSSYTTIKVYPGGLTAAWEIKGKCANTPLTFTDKSTALYGTVSKWFWDFGDLNQPNNTTSTLSATTHQYPKAGYYPVHLNVETSKGCSARKDTALTIMPSLPIEITHDTLICTIDTLQLKGLATGTVIWSPNYMIDDLSSHTPLVSPDVTTTYHVTATDQFGCKGTDSVKVKVLDHVTQFLSGKDTAICQNDPIVLQLESDAIYFEWTPNDGSLNNTSIRSPIAHPSTTTTYHVIGSISKKCFAEDNITVKAIPYPRPNLGPDINVCLGNSTKLHASGAAYYNWSPAIYLSSTNIADPLVNNPATGVRYIVAARDTLGCPKSVRDTILVKVISIKANAGNDTSVVIGQPLQLHASGGLHYAWDPGNWLSSPHIADPVALPQDDIRYTVTVSDDNGCVGTDDILVKYYKLDPGPYLPNAFTPNGDGKNDRFEPIELGLKSLEIFQVYNRWGKLIYQTSDMRKGWDGKFNGNPQEPATYVWYAEGTDYTGKKVNKKGTVILLR